MLSPKATRTAFLDNFNDKRVETTMREYYVDEPMLQMILDKYKKMIQAVSEIKICHWDICESLWQVDYEYEKKMQKLRLRRAVGLDRKEISRG